MKQDTLDLFTPTVVELPSCPSQDFDGMTYLRDRDGARLNAQLARVLEALKDHDWHTLDALEKVTEAPQASISARIRDLRKAKFGGYRVERRYLHDGLWEYRLEP